MLPIVTKINDIHLTTYLNWPLTKDKHYVKLYKFGLFSDIGAALIKVFLYSLFTLLFIQKTRGVLRKLD